MASQFINQLQLAAEQFLQVKTEALKDWRSSCQCPKPGNDSKCSTCPSFRALIQQIHSLLALQSGETFPTLLAPELRAPYSKQLQQECIDLFALGYTPRQIQQLTGVTDLNAMRQWFSKAGLVKKGADYSAEVRETCLRLYLDGLSREQIEEQTGVSAAIVSSWITRAGISRPKRTYLDTERQNCINLYLQRNSYKTVETLTGVPASVVQQWVQESGMRRARISKGGRTQVYSMEFRQRCLDLLEQGFTTAQVEEKMDVSADTVRKWRKDFLH